MNEKEFAAKLKPWLDRTAAGVGEMQATRLRAARLRALDAYREPVRLLGLIPVAAGTAQTLRYSVVQRTLLWLPVVALLATLAYQSAREPDIGDLDAQLLTQELPPDAFLDKDFRAWLDGSRG
jgi:Protein of unknown function (DUF3619)